MSPHPHRAAAALASVALCALLAACNHTSSFDIPASSPIAGNGGGANAGNPGAGMPGNNNPGGAPPRGAPPGGGPGGANPGVPNPGIPIITNPGNPGINPPGNPGLNNPGVTEPGGAVPQSALSLLDPVTGLIGQTLMSGGAAVTDLTDVAPTTMLIDRVVARVGDELIDLGSSLRDNGTADLWMVGGTLQNAGAALDSAATISVLDEAIGGTSPVLGVSVMSPSQTGGSLISIGVLSDGALATTSLTPDPGLAAVLSDALSGAPAPVLPVVSAGSSLVGVTALNEQIGGPAPLVGVSVLGGAPAQGSLASVDVLSSGPVVDVTLAGNPVTPVAGAAPSVVGAVTPVVGAVTGVVGAVTPVGGGAVTGVAGAVAPVASGAGIGLPPVPPVPSPPPAPAAGAGGLPVVGGLLGR